TLFPYTTLFRGEVEDLVGAGGIVLREALLVEPVDRGAQCGGGGDVTLRDLGLEVAIRPQLHVREPAQPFTDRVLGVAWARFGSLEAGHHTVVEPVFQMLRDDGRVRVLTRLARPVQLLCHAVACSTLRAP